MYIEYKGQLYHLIMRSLFFDGKPAISTHFKEKTDNTFFECSDYYAKELKPNDADVQNIYEVDFYVVYHDTSKTVEMALKRWKKYMEQGDEPDDFTKDRLFRHTWLTETSPTIFQHPKIENNEVAIVLDSESCSEDWITFERGFCSKIVDIYDCEKLLVRYTYSVREGKKLKKSAKNRVVEVTMEPEDFKAEMLKYRISNI